MAELRPLTPHERRTLSDVICSTPESDPAFKRAWLIASLAAGRNPKKVAREVTVSLQTVYQWMRRFNAAGLAGLKELPRGPRRRPRRAATQHKGDGAQPLL